MEHIQNDNKDKMLDIRQLYILFIRRNHMTRNKSNIIYNLDDGSYTARKNDIESL